MDAAVESSGADQPVVPVGAIVRSARAVSGLSQRELAVRMGVSKSAVGRMEMDEDGRRVTVRMFTMALAACGLALHVEGRGGDLLADADRERDHAGRRFPPHLDPFAPMSRLDWWAVHYRYQCYLDGAIPWPRRTFYLDRDRRDSRRGRLPYPWDARHWTQTVALAPPDEAHPAIAAQERYRRIVGAEPFMAPRP